MYQQNLSTCYTNTNHFLCVLTQLPFWVFIIFKAISNFQQETGFLQSRDFVLLYKIKSSEFSIHCRILKQNYGYEKGDLLDAMNMTYPDVTILRNRQNLTNSGQIYAQLLKSLCIKIKFREEIYPP
ncbi:hypothetical protein PV02_11315 [Methanolobus chelungpuianus]|uniref:Uncharacterized protein n=1 Tax=Methanolobus chelungpuianus TaxID=502115 RepID=A0AAE3HE04_9EURY|nr:hypothetical protein [Methanolobus chelungpuianus]